MLLCSGDKLVVRPMSCVDVPSELQIVCTVKSSVPGSSAKISRARTDWPQAPIAVKQLPTDQLFLPQRGKAPRKNCTDGMRCVL